jgi:DNA primase
VALVSLTDKVRFIESVFGGGKLARNGKNIDVRCPICAPKDHTKKKLAIRVDDDRNHCWTCGYRAHTLAPLIRKYAGPEKLAEYREKFMPETEQERLRRRYDIDAEELKRIELPKDFRLLVTAPATDPDARAAFRYVIDRGLTERDMWYFKLGISDEPRWNRRVIVPSFDAAGRLNYFVARAIDKKRKPKYDNPDFDKLPVIFNELNVDWTKQLVLCEGSFDMFKCGDNAVPLLGSDLNEESALFNAILVNGTPIALALDGDMWETKTLKAAKKLAEYDIDVVLVDTRPFGDPGSATREQFRMALECARPFAWESAFMTRLGRASRTTLGL